MKYVHFVKMADSGPRTYLTTAMNINFTKLIFPYISKPFKICNRFFPDPNGCTNRDVYKQETAEAPPSLCG